ncbi:family 10 glycosylhydrolase [Actinoplanes sp. NPDC089786]|uniref:glycoside hydrolase family 10 protein n=1 Tax=Actinoplanes sp. NPDC089786 TaxID=3155185 RepID=UPI00341DE013
MRLRRPPLKITAIVVVSVIALAAIAVGLIRAATYEPPAAQPVGPAAVEPVTGVTGRCAGAPVDAPRELRGMWLTTVTNIDWPSRPGLSEAQVKKEYLDWLALAQAQNHNAIFVHVRPSGDAFWESKYAPWSEWLTGKRDGKSPGWDPMQFMIDEAHQRNLEFHAWFNPYRGTQPGPKGPGADFAKLAPNHPLIKHREWSISYPTGPKARLYFDPGIPEARRFVEDSMLEAVQKYDVDGVHFDDFFYPYPEGTQDFPDNASYAKYARPGQSKAAWRRANVNTLVREMDQRIKQMKPWVKFGISPFGIWRNARTDPLGSDSKGLQSNDEIYADTRTWVLEGWVDYIVPQLYWAIGFDKAAYEKVLPWWSKLVKGTDVQLYIGQGDYRVGEKGPWSDPAQIDRQLALNDQYAVQGSVHFSAKQIRADRLGSVSRYRKAHYASPALVPLMKQLPNEQPSTPRLVAARKSAPGGTMALDWQAGDKKPASWALYRVDGPKAALVSTGRAGTAPAAPGPGTYCLSGLDRSGNESPISSPLTIRP